MKWKIKHYKTFSYQQPIADSSNFYYHGLCARLLSACPFQHFSTGIERLSQINATPEKLPHGTTFTNYTKEQKSRTP